MVERARVGIAQWLPDAGDPDANLAHALAAIAELGERGCDLIVLPELWPCGFRWTTLAADVAAAAEPLDGPRTRALAAASAAAGALVLAGTVPEAEGGAVFNTALLLDATGRLLGSHRKAHLYTPLGEHAAVAAGDALTVIATELLGPVGIATCFDGDFPETARALRRAGARVVLHPSAYEVEAARWWDVLYPAHALGNGQWWISANQCGTDGAGTLLGGSRILAPDGRVVAEAPRAQVGATPPAALLVADLALAGELEAWDGTAAVLLDGARPQLDVTVYEEVAHG